MECLVGSHVTMLLHTCSGDLRICIMEAYLPIVVIYSQEYVNVAYH
jgi:hypothetical protein